jgi:hypothetical protein
MSSKVASSSRQEPEVDDMPEYSFEDVVLSDATSVKSVGPDNDGNAEVENFEEFGHEDAAEETLPSEDYLDEASPLPTKEEEEFEEAFESQDYSDEVSPLPTKEEEEFEEAFESQDYSDEISPLPTEEEFEEIVVEKKVSPPSIAPKPASKTIAKKAPVNKSSAPTKPSGKKVDPEEEVVFEEVPAPVKKSGMLVKKTAPTKNKLPAVPSDYDEEFSDSESQPKKTSPEPKKGNVPVKSAGKGKVSKPSSVISPKVKEIEEEEEILDDDESIEDAGLAMKKLLELRNAKAKKNAMNEQELFWDDFSSKAENNYMGCMNDLMSGTHSLKTMKYVFASLASKLKSHVIENSVATDSSGKEINSVEIPSGYYYFPSKDAMVKSIDGVMLRHKDFSVDCAKAVSRQTLRCSKSCSVTVFKMPYSHRDAEEALKFYIEFIGCEDYFCKKGLFDQQDEEENVEEGVEEDGEFDEEVEQEVNEDAEFEEFD